MGSSVVVVEVDVLEVVETTVDVEVFLVRGENLLTGFKVVLLKSPESIEDGVNSGRLGINGRSVVDGF